ncbi:hypothetical protein [Novosphingobium panipatense]|uniref:hypothetical protein n=1 Tax=Novosphingobium panipatense TaxID=428991 RepID=UPI00361ABB87
MNHTSANQFKSKISLLSMASVMVFPAAAMAQVAPGESEETERNRRGDRRYRAFAQFAGHADRNTRAGSIG